jgi:segregation and condensation protein B
LDNQKIEFAYFPRIKNYNLFFKKTNNYSMRKKALLEAALFVSEKPLSLEKICSLLNSTQEEAKKIISEIQREMKKEERGIELVETPLGYELRIKPEYRDKIAPLAPLSDLSEGMLRTLAIVAVKQPVKQSIIVRYQGNKVYGYVKSLEEKGLIKTEKFGRTKLISTTSEFEKYFGKSSKEIQEALKKSNNICKNI